MANIGNKEGTIIIAGVPDSLTSEEKKNLITQVQSASGGGFKGYYDKANELLSRPSSLGAMPVTSTEETWEAPTDNEVWETPPETPGRANTRVSLENLSGAAGGVVRDKSRTAALTAGGAAIGSVVPGMGTALGAGAGLVTSEIVLPIVDAGINLANKLFDKEFETTAEAWEKLMDEAGIDKPENAAERIVSAGASGALDAASVVNLGKLLQRFGPELGDTAIKNIGRVIAAEPAQEFAGSVGAELAATGTQEALADSNMSEGAKTALTAGAGLVGAFAGSGVTTPVARRQAASSTPITSSQRDAIEQGQRLGIEPTTSDILASKSSKATQRQQKGVAARFGTADMYFDRNNARIRKADEFGRSYDIEINGLGKADNFDGEIAAEFLQRRADDVRHNANLKRDVIERLSGEPIPEYEVIIDPELGTTLTVSRNELVPEGVRVPDEASPDLVAREITTPNTVKVDDTLQLIDDARAQMIEDGLTSDNKVINLITDWENALQDKNLAAIERIRRKISNEWTDPNRSIGQDEKALYRKIYTSLNKEMGEFIKKEGSNADYNQWKTANTRLSEMANDFKISGLNTALREGDTTPTAVTNLLWNNDVERVKDLYNGLDAQGKKLAKKALVGKMMEDSFPANATDISPNALSEQMKRYEKPISVFFDADERKQMEGLRKLFNSTAFHEQVASSSAGIQAPNPNVVPGVGPLIAGAARGNPLPVLTVSASGIGIRGAWYRHYENPSVRNLMIQLSNTKPQTTASEIVSKRLVETLRSLDENEDKAEQGGAQILQDARMQWEQP
jgi:hypothetical protein